MCKSSLWLKPLVAASACASVCSLSLNAPSNHEQPHSSAAAASEPSDQLRLSESQSVQSTERATVGYGRNELYLRMAMAVVHMSVGQRLRRPREQVRSQCRPNTIHSIIGRLTAIERSHASQISPGIIFIIQMWAPDCTASSRDEPNSFSPPPKRSREARNRTQLHPMKR